MDFKRDYRDIFGGAVLTATGIFIALYAQSHYELGSFRRMGAGMFPLLLGIALALLGFMVMVPAFFRPGSRPKLRVWSPLFVLSSIAAFALIVVPFGLIPAIVAVTVISSMAELRLRPLSLGLLALGLSLAAWLIFTVALGVPFRLFINPF